MTAKYPLKTTNNHKQPQVRKIRPDWALRPKHGKLGVSIKNPGTILSSPLCLLPLSHKSLTQGQLRFLGTPKIFPFVAVFVAFCSGKIL